METKNIYIYIYKSRVQTRSERDAVIGFVIANIPVLDNRCMRGENDRLEIYRSRRDRLLIISRGATQLLLKRILRLRLQSKFVFLFFLPYSRAFHIRGFISEILWKASCYIRITQIKFNLTGCAQ